MDVVILLESELTFGCPIEMFGDRRIPRWGDVAEQGSRYNFLQLLGYSVLKQARSLEC